MITKYIEQPLHKKQISNNIEKCPNFNNDESIQEF